VNHQEPEEDLNSLDPIP